MELNKTHKSNELVSEWSFFSGLLSRQKQSNNTYALYASKIKLYIYTELCNSFNISTWTLSQFLIFFPYCLSLSLLLELIFHLGLNMINKKKSPEHDQNDKFSIKFAPR